MDTTRILVDWSELEPSPGVYDLAPLVEQLTAANERELRAFVTLSTLDSEGFTIPEDLLVDEVTLADSMSPDDPVIVARLEAVLAEVVPVLVDHDAFLLAIANESRAWLDDNQGETEAVISLLEQGILHSQSLASKLPVGVTMVGADFGDAFVERMVAVSDVAIFNLGCLDSNLNAVSIDDAHETLAELLAATGDREVVFQEFGCPSGVPGGSEAYQQEYMEAMFTAFEAEPRVRSVFMFQLVDWSDGLSANFSTSLRDAGLDDLADNLYAWLSTTGLIHYEDGATRPALTTFLEAISRSGGNPAVDTDPTASGDTVVALDRLSPGTHYGVSWFSPPKPGTEANLIAALEQAEEAGSDIKRVLLDWTEMETAPGVYDLSALREELVDMTESGIQPMATISFVGDTDQFIPAHYGDWTDTEELAAAYGDLLEAVVPILTEHNVWALSIANEPEVAMGEGFLTAEDFRRFSELVVARSHSLDPDLPVTATLGAAQILNREAYVPGVIDEYDLVMLNHYCLNDDFSVVGADEVEGRFDTLLAAAGDKPLVFQEFGCPASDAMGSSEDFQAEWFAAALERFHSEPQVRAAFAFELLDWSPELVELAYGEYLSIPGIGEQFRLWLETTGLFAYEDASPRAAWEVFIAAVRAS